MQFPFEAFLCMLFGVVCVVFIAWVLRQGNDSFITTTEYTSVPGDIPSPAQFTAPPLGPIEFTNMRLLVYYSRIAVQAVDQMVAAGEIKDTDSRKAAAINMVLSYCRVDGMDADNDIIAAIPTIIEYVVAESKHQIF